MNLCFCYSNKDGIEDRLAEAAAIMFLEDSKDTELFIKEGINNDCDVKVLITIQMDNHSKISIDSKHAARMMECLKSNKGFIKALNVTKEDITYVDITLNCSTFEKNKKIVMERLAKMISSVGSVALAEQMILEGRRKFTQKLELAKVKKAAMENEENLFSDEEK